MLPDTRILRRHGSCEILAQRHEVMLRDGLAVIFHPVLHSGVPAGMWRAVELPNGQLALLHLHSISPAMCQELRLAHERDRPGVLFFTLRHLYRTRAELLAAVLKVCTLLPMVTEPAEQMLLEAA